MLGGKKEDHKDYSKAFEYYQKSCNLDDNWSCNHLGGMYNERKGVEEDYFKALEYWKKACNLGNAKTCFFLGNICFQGVNKRIGSMHFTGLNQSYSEAKKYWQNACDLKDIESCRKLGDMYKEGVYVEQDDYKATEYYEKASKLVKSRELYDEFMKA